MASSVFLSLALTRRLRWNAGESVGNVRVMVNSIEFPATTPHPSSDPNSWSLGPKLPILHVSNENLLEFADGLIVVVDEFRKATDLATDVYAGRWVGHAKGVEDALQATVALSLFRDMQNL